MPPPSGEAPKDYSLRQQLTLIKLFVRYYKPYRGLLLLDISVIILNPLLTMLLPLLIYRVLEVYLPARDVKMLVISLSGMMVLSALTAATEYISTRWGHILGVRMESDMRGDLFRHIQKLSFSYFDKTKTGHIMSRISNDLTMIAEVAHHCPEDLIFAGLMFIGAFSIMLWINPLMTLLTVIPLPLIILWGTLFQGKMRNAFRQVRRDVAEINSQVENSIQGVREVKSYQNEGHEIEKFDKVNNDFRITRESVTGILAAFHSGMMFLMQSYNLVFIVMGILLLYWGKTTLPEIVTFLMYSRYITMPIFRLIGFVEQYLQGMTAFERFHEIMTETPEITDPPQAIHELPHPLQGKITFDHVFFRYHPIAYDASGPQTKEQLTQSDPPSPVEQEAKWVLNDISITIPAGKTVALVGESGAGKSTMAALIPRFYEVGDGRITLDDVDIRRFSQYFLRSKIGIVQQTPFLFDSTIRENILFGKPDASEEALIEAAKNANIYDFIMTMPNGLDSICGERGVMLSGGQKQRISLARVFLKNPPVLIFDEATSALDNESEALVQDSMERLCRNRTTIIIAHRLSTVRNADYVFCLRNGRVEEYGSHHELLEKNGYYKKLYTMHSF